MKQVLEPSRLLLGWFGALLGLTVVLGTLTALGIDLPATLSAAGWGLLLALVLISLIDALRLTRLPSPRLPLPRLESFHRIFRIPPVPGTRSPCS